jgi:hypothetical protein
MINSNNNYNLDELSRSNCNNNSHPRGECNKCKKNNMSLPEVKKKDGKIFIIIIII